VPDVPVVMLVVTKEHVYCEDEHALLHAANATGILKAKTAKTATITEIILFIF
jgi:ribosomal protein L18